MGLNVCCKESPEGNDLPGFCFGIQDMFVKKLAMENIVYNAQGFPDWKSTYQHIMTDDIAQKIYHLRNEGYSWRALAREMMDTLPVSTGGHYQKCGIEMCYAAWQHLGKEYSYFNE